MRTSPRPARLTAVGKADYVGGMVFEPVVAEFRFTTTKMSWSAILSGRLAGSVPRQWSSSKVLGRRTEPDRFGE